MSDNLSDRGTRDRALRRARGTRAALLGQRSGMLSSRPCKKSARARWRCVRTSATVGARNQGARADDLECMLPSMSSKRAILSELSRAELLAFAEQVQTEVSDRRVRQNVIDALAGSRRARVPAYLATLPRERLKELCRALGISDAGRDKGSIVERLVGGSAQHALPHASAVRAPKPSAASAPLVSRKKPGRSPASR
jgi:hypothetical protein